MTDEPQTCGWEYATKKLEVSRKTLYSLVDRSELHGWRDGTGPTAPWVFHTADVDHLAAVRAHEKRVRELGPRGGFGDEGIVNSVNAAARHFGWSEEQRLAEIERQRARDADEREDERRIELYARVQREVFMDIAEVRKGMTDEEIVDLAAREIRLRVDAVEAASRAGDEA